MRRDIFSSERISHAPWLDLHTCGTTPSLLPEELHESSVVIRVGFLHQTSPLPLTLFTTRKHYVHHTTLRSPPGVCTVSRHDQLARLTRGRRRCPVARAARWLLKHCAPAGSLVRSRPPTWLRGGLWPKLAAAGRRGRYARVRRRGPVSAPVRPRRRAAVYSRQTRRPAAPRIGARHERRGALCRQRRQSGCRP